SAVTADDEGNVDFLAAEVHDAGVTLVIMRMRRQESVRVDAGFLTHRIDLPQHGGTRNVVAAGAGRIVFGQVNERWMMGRNRHRSRIILLPDPLQLGAEKID